MSNKQHHHHQQQQQPEGGGGGGGGGRRATRSTLELPDEWVKVPVELMESTYRPGEWEPIEGVVYYSRETNSE